MTEISTMEICLVSFCEHRCKYCPQKDLHQAYKNIGIESSPLNQNYMSFEQFKIALAKIPNHTWIDFSGNFLSLTLILRLNPLLPLRLIFAVLTSHPIIHSAPKFFLMFGYDSFFWFLGFLPIKLN